MPRFQTAPPTVAILDRRLQYFPNQMLEDVSNFKGYTMSGKLAVDLPVEQTVGEYLREPHIVFAMDEMLRYIAFREILYQRDNPM